MADGEHSPAERVGRIAVGPEQGKAQHRKGHGLTMTACCVPMLVIAVALVATGAASPAPGTLR